MPYIIIFINLFLIPTYVIYKYLKRNFSTLHTSLNVTQLMFYAFQNLSSLSQMKQPLCLTLRKKAAVYKIVQSGFNYNSNLITHYSPLMSTLLVISIFYFYFHILCTILQNLKNQIWLSKRTL
jgi:hypothetical protein